MLDTTLNRITHHLGNAAQILSFVKKDSPDLKRAFALLIVAMELVKKENDEKSISIPDDSEIKRVYGEEDSKALEQAKAP